MDVRKKMVLIVTASILLTAVPGGALMYGYAQRNILQHEGAELEKTTAIFSSTVMQRFSQGEPKLKALAEILQQELTKPLQPGELAEFYRRMERNADGVWRNRKLGYDGTRESGVFLPANAQESDLQKIRHLRIKRVMDTFGAAASKPFENVWYLSPHRSEIIFDRALPGFAFDQKADNDYTQTPWVTYTSPDLNPGREFRFTPPLYDPVPKIWMVSALYPLYVDGEWIGSLGEDMQLSGVLETMFASGQIFPGVQHFLLDKAGNYVLAGPWQKQLESTPETFRPDLGEEPELAALLKSALTDSPAVLGDDVTIQGRRYLAIGMRMQPLGWQYFRLTPVDEIMAYTRQLFIGLMTMILLVTALSGMLIGTAVGASITRRIRTLSDVMRGYSRDHRSRISDRLTGDDEISEVAHVFDDMADDIDRSISEQKMAEERLSTLFVAIEQSPISIVITDLDANLLYVNPQFIRSTGYSAEEVLGINPRLLQSGLTAKEIYRDMWDTVTAGKIWHGELINRRKNGDIYWEEAHISPVHNEAGKITQYVGIKIDITGRKKSDDAILQLNRRLQDLLNAASEVAIIATDERGLITTFNRGAELMLGYSATEVEQIETPALFHLDMEIANRGRELSQQMVNEITGFNVLVTIPRIDGQEQREWTYVRKDGSHLTVSLAVTTVRSIAGEITGFLGIAQDITPQKKIEHDLIEARDAAEAGARIKSAFLANMSHEIRTPMNGIIGLTQLVLNKPISPEVRDYLDKIRSSADSLLGILNDILDYSKMEAGRMVIEQQPFDLDTVINNLANLFSIRADEKQLRFVVDVAADVPRGLIGDALRLQQVLTNLLGNAFKFTSQGQVGLHIRLVPTDNGTARLRFCVQDTGIGMAQEDIARLFLPFSQVDGSITRRFGGTGLGLTISHNLLGLMDSQFDVTSTLGQGSSFCFELTLGTVAHEKPEQERRQGRRQAGALSSGLRERGQDLAGMHILVAEDNHINQQVVREFLQLSGMQVDVAENGQQALDLLEQKPFDAVLMDAHMPVMGGVEATWQIRKQARFFDLPIIALTAGVTSEERENCMAAGMNDFIAKPVNPDELLAALRQWIKPRTASAAGNPEALRAAAQELDRLLRDSEFIPNELLASLEAHLPSAMRPQFVMLRKQITDIDYKKARQTLDEMIQQGPVQES